MSVVFAVRGDSFTPRNSQIPKHALNHAGLHSIVSDAGALGGNAIRIGNGTNQSAVKWPGFDNLPDGGPISILIRFKNQYSGNPSGNRSIFYFGAYPNIFVQLYQLSSGTLAAIFTNDSVVFTLNGTGLSATPGFSNSDYSDLVMTYTGDNSFAGLKFFINGAQVYQANTTNSWGGYDQNSIASFGVGGGGVQSVQIPHLDLNELVIWDEVIDPTAVDLTTGSGALSGSSRTAFVDVAAFAPTTSTDPGVDNVRSGVNYNINGTDKVGTFLCNQTEVESSDYWAPMELQKALFNKLAGDQTLADLLGATIEVQRLTFASTPSSGSFKFSYGGETSEALLAANINATNLQASLRSIEALENVTVALVSSNVYDVTMLGQGGNTNIIATAENTLDVALTISEQTAGVQRVYDHVPQDAPQPYIVLQPLPFNDRGSHTYEGFECEYQITSWYRSPSRGFKGVQEIQKRIDDLLHKTTICVEGYRVVNTRRTFIDIAVSDDNVTLQGLQRFNLLLGGN